MHMKMSKCREQLNIRCRATTDTSTTLPLYPRLRGHCERVGRKAERTA